MKSENSKTGLCFVCGKTKNISELMPALFVRANVAGLIKNDGCNWDPKGFVCLDDLNKYRSAYIQKVLEEEKGSLSTYDKEVLDSITGKEILSKNINDEIDNKITLGERISDRIAEFGGSWIFISLFMSFLVIWMLINIIVLSTHPFDPYPFILLNLILSCIAAIQAPIIMMSQNRQEAKDRLRSQHDYQVNLKAEIEIRQINDKIDHLLMQHGQKMLEIQQIQLELMEEIAGRLKK